MFSGDHRLFHRFCNRSCNKSLQSNIRNLNENFLRESPKEAVEEIETESSDVFETEETMEDQERKTFSNVTKPSLDGLT
ncbi:hypothetical protein L1987_09479 [Smallanthus sonchifolius]|uniref:Uncharacterized protein n=1 Tax=Smallanthus sonchifolius TaxID=185202 RepID=A0ACB9JN33_9ASTR|nr:hypothetical protein L1987_09479 [Smallanthus sonchifolius]